MEVEPPGAHRAVAATAAAGQWPARTQRLLDAIQKLCVGWLHEPLRLCLGDFDRRLHEQSERTRSHVDQQRYLATRKRLLQEREAFEQRFVASIATAFAQLGATVSAAPVASSGLSLSLLDTGEHELTAAMDQLVARNEARNGPLLVELSYRLAVLIGAPPLEAEALPLGPQAMVRAFRDASAALGLPSEHHLLLLQSLEGTLTQGLGLLYENVNTRLTDDGILTGLRVFAVPRAEPRAPRAPRTADAPVASAPVAESGRAPDHANSELANLRELLARQRGEACVPDSPGGATTEQLLGALLAVQQQLGQATALAAKPRSATWLRAALLLHLAAQQAPGAPPLRLGALHDDILELCARLFEQLARQLPAGDHGLPLVAALQLPWLRLAVADPGFFARRGHPAQHLLERLVTIAHEWLAEPLGEGAQGLRDKLDPLLDLLRREPPSGDLHARVLAELEPTLAQLEHRALLAERRLVEAMQGHERLEQARLSASALMSERFARSPPRGLLRTLLERAWSDVLALTLLRHGEHSEAFASRMVVTDQLLGQLPAGNLQTLRRELEAGLQQIGIHGEEATQVAQRLIGAGISATDDDTPSATTLALRLKQRQRAGETNNLPPVSALDAATIAPEQRRLHEHLAQRRSDRWFEFTEPASGRVVERKLAWHSPDTGLSLFVNRYGQRSEQLSLPQLAGAIASGRVRERPPARDSLLDRAWRALALEFRQPRGTPGASR